MDKNRENITEEELRALEELENELKDAYKIIVRNALKKEYESKKDNADVYFDPDRELNDLNTLDELRGYALNSCMDDLKAIPGTENITVTKENIEEACDLFDAAVHDWYINEYKWLEDTNGQKIAEDKVEDEQYEPQTYTEEEMTESDAVPQSDAEEGTKSDEKEAAKTRLYNARRHYILEHMDDYRSIRQDVSKVDYDASRPLSLLGGKMGDADDEAALEWYEDEVYESRCAYVMDGYADLSEETAARYIEDNLKSVPDDERAWELYHDEYLIPMRERAKEADEAAKAQAAKEAEEQKLADEQAEREVDEQIEKERERFHKKEAERKAKALAEEALNKSADIKKDKKEIKEDKDVLRKSAEEIAFEKAEQEKFERRLEENEVQYKKVRSETTVKTAPEKLRHISSRIGEELRKVKTHMTESIDVTKYNAALRELAEELDSTGSVFSRDSKEFKNMNSYLKAVSKTDLSEKQLKQAFNAIRLGVKAYEDHAKADPRPQNKRRNDRLNIMGALSSLADSFDAHVNDPEKAFEKSANNQIINVLYGSVKSNGYTEEQIKEKVARSESYRKYMDGLSLCEMHKIAKDPKEAKNAVVSIHNAAVKAKESKADAAESKDPDDNIVML